MNNDSIEMTDRKYALNLAKEYLRAPRVPINNPCHVSLKQLTEIAVLIVKDDTDHALPLGVLNEAIMLFNDIRLGCLPSTSVTTQQLLDHGLTGAIKSFLSARNGEEAKDFEKISQELLSRYKVNKTPQELRLLWIEKDIDMLEVLNAQQEKMASHAEVFLRSPRLSDSRERELSLDSLISLASFVA